MGEARNRLLAEYSKLITRRSTSKIFHNGIGVDHMVRAMACFIKSIAGTLHSREERASLERFLTEQKSQVPLRAHTDAAWFENLFVDCTGGDYSLVSIMREGTALLVEARRQK